MYTHIHKIHIRIFAPALLQATTRSLDRARQRRVHARTRVRALAVA